ncbi:hypothetical protein NA57DRAFT_33729 [Rhizodiscina lignyota]|uniref:Uncharacterized protein n=1 Tax=Rhizodiscina lignyota TaxID=1504668 RepID=A0A9P4IL56_9PEZI|nr:hypothetical protein NA57DRAFT_33729 [Rhizodiscina lignyota]
MKILTRTYETFWSCAVFLAFSIQVAVIVALVRVDYGFSATGMGSLTKEITWTVSLFSIVPLLHVILFPELLDDLPETRQSAGNPSRRMTEPKAGDRSPVRFAMFLACWVVSIYPFVTGMLTKFGPSQIGSGPSSVISTDDFNNIDSVCWKGIHQISSSEDMTMTSFRMLTWITITLLTTGQIVLSGVQKHHSDSTLVRFLDRSAERKKWWYANVREIMLVILPILSISQMWTYIRLQTIQFQVSAVNNNNDSDSQWTFGQVVTVKMFIPVCVDLAYWIRAPE